MTTSLTAATYQNGDTSYESKSLLSACQSLGVKTNIDELTRLCGKDNASPVLERLALAAKKKGLYTVVQKIRSDDFPALKSPAIAMMWDTRCVLVEHTPEGKLKITDTSPGTQPVTVDDFKNAYSGIALVIAKDEKLLPKSSVKGPDMRFDEYVIDHGAINQDDKVEKTFKFKNVGNEELKISSVRSTCGCTAALVSQKSIPPNGQGEIKVTFNTKGKQGIQHQKIYIQSNDPVTPIAQVQLTGTVISAKVSVYPRGVDFGTLRDGEIASKDINVFDSGGYDFKVTKVVSDSPFVNCVVIATGDTGHPKYSVIVSLTRDTPPGELKAKVSITTTHPREPVVEIPISAIVKNGVGQPVLQAYFGSIKKSLGARQVFTISSARKTRFKIDSIDNPMNGLLVKTNITNDGSAYDITLTVPQNSPVSLLDGDIIIHTHDHEQSAIKIHVYGRVVE